MCSLAASSTPKAVFEDVTDITPITISKGMIFDKDLVSGEANSFHRIGGTYWELHIYRVGHKDPDALF